MKLDDLIRALSRISDGDEQILFVFAHEDEFNAAGPLGKNYVYRYGLLREMRQASVHNIDVYSNQCLMTVNPWIVRY